LPKRRGSYTGPDLVRLKVRTTFSTNDDVLNQYGRRGLGWSAGDLPGRTYAMAIRMPGQLPNATIVVDQFHMSNPPTTR
jgi:hypothetical protein